MHGLVDFMELCLFLFILLFSCLRSKFGIISFDLNFFFFFYLFLLHIGGPDSFVVYIFIFIYHIFLLSFISLID